MTEETIMTVKDAADYLQVSDDLIYNAINKGQLHCYRLGNGRAIRISNQQIRDYLDLVEGGQGAEQYTVEEA